MPELAPLPADALAAAFDLGTPTADPVLVQHTSFPTWRLTTDAGSYLVKRLWQGADPDWWRSRADGMDFEGRVLAAGVAAPRPVEPIAPQFGYAARVAGSVYRVHAWLDHRPVGPSDDVTGWLAQTLVTLHGLEPVGTAPDPLWWGLYDATTWLDWQARASHAGKPWAAPLAHALPGLLHLSSRLRSVYERADDRVVTHGDVEPYNVLMTADGPFLIDWDSVGPESATLEVGRTAVAFAGGDEARSVALLQSYVDHGGTLLPLGEDLLLRPAALRLCHLTERIEASLGLGVVPGWLNETTLDAAILDRLTSVPATALRLTGLAKRL